MPQASGASGSTPRPRNLYGFVDHMEEEERRRLEQEQPPQPLQEEEEEETEPMKDPSEDDSARSVASSQPGRRSPSPPPSPPAPRAPTPPRQDAPMNLSDGRFPAQDPYFQPRLPRDHPWYHLGHRRQGEEPHRPVYGVPPPPPIGMTREEREMVWGIANGFRDARLRVRTQEVMMERALGVMDRTGDYARLAISEVRRVNEVIFMMGCVLTAVCTLVVALMLRK